MREILGGGFQRAPHAESGMGGLKPPALALPPSRPVIFASVDELFGKNQKLEMPRLHNYAPLP